MEGNAILNWRIGETSEMMTFKDDLKEGRKQGTWLPGGSGSGRENGVEAGMCWDIRKEASV